MNSGYDRSNTSIGTHSTGMIHRDQKSQLLLDLIVKVRGKLRLSSLSSYQRDYINTTLSSLDVLINSLETEYNKSLSHELYIKFNSVILGFDSLICDTHTGDESPTLSRSRSKIIQTEPIRPSSHRDSFYNDSSNMFTVGEVLEESTHVNDLSPEGEDKIDHSKSFTTPIKNSFSRSSSISKATITKDPIHIEGTNFRRFTTPGIDNRFKHSIKEVLRMSSPVRHDDDYSKSFESNNIFLD